MSVTVTGGTGHGPAALRFDSAGLAEMNAQALAANIDRTYSTATYYNPAKPPAGASGGYLIVPTNTAGNAINAAGFGAIVDENNKVSSTVMGGGNASGQIVLAGDGGLTFSASQGSVTVVAGGGANSIRLANDTSVSAVYTANGNDTIYGGGAGTISAGLGENYVSLRYDAGSVLVDTYGQDTIQLGIGSDTIDAIGHGSDVIGGATTYSGSGFSLTFVGSSAASTVLGGAGSYDIHGGRGGGVFRGGSAGNNSIVGGTGAVTIYGGGAGDTLQGGSATDRIVAGLGNETLGGGGGQNSFNLTVHGTFGIAGLDTTVTISDFSTKDFFKLGSVAADQYAMSTMKVDGSNTSFKLEDGATVVLHGFTHLTSSDFRG